MKKIFSLIFSVLIFAVFAEDDLRVSDIRVEGLQRTDPGLIFNNIPFEINDPINDIDFSKSISLIYKTGQFRDASQLYLPWRETGACGISFCCTVNY